MGISDKGIQRLSRAILDSDCIHMDVNGVCKEALGGSITVKVNHTPTPEEPYDVANKVVNSGDTCPFEGEPLNNTYCKYYTEKL